MNVVHAPNLRFVSDTEPGFGRRRSGRHFRYVDRQGRSLRDSATIDRIRGLVIPPAWNDVWICASPDGYLQATGRDAKGRKQYRYHASWRALREQAKFDRLAEFGQALPHVRRTVTADLTAPGLCREKVLATVVRLLETTLVRVGNEEYARANDSYGLTTLRNGHAKLCADGMRLVFKGKSGQPHEVGITDRRILRIVRACKKLPGQHLFEYRDSDGTLQVVNSEDVNEYLRAASGLEITAKDFRTWVATRLAASILAGLPEPSDEKAARQAVVEMTRQVSKELRNTPAVCRASYIHPAVIDAYERGALQAHWSKPARAARGLLADERRLLALLGAKRRPRCSQPASAARGDRAA
jgi:DNA topoisomerase I